MPTTTLQFTASDGRQIDLLGGWFESLAGWPLGAKTFQEHVAQVVAGGKAYPTGFPFFMNKLWTAQAMAELLRQHGVRFPIDGPVLDLCTGPAILPRAFKALGLCTEAHGIDIHSRLEDYPDTLMVKYWRDARRIPGRDDNASFFESTFLDNNERQTGLNNAGSIAYADFDAERVAMDGYITGDLIEDCPDRTFPLLTLAAGMEYFDVSAFFSTVSRLLAPGGVFAAFNYYFYDAWAGLFMPMDAPWLHCRVSQEDLMRYYETLRPEVYEAVKTKTGIQKPAPFFTVHDFRELAATHGLDLIGYRRARAKEEVVFYLFTNEAFRQLMYSVVLPDCRVMNPKVQMDDLFTRVLITVYRKSGR